MKPTRLEILVMVVVLLAIAMWALVCACGCTTQAPVQVRPCYSLLIEKGEAALDDCRKCHGVVVTESENGKRYWFLPKGGKRI